MARTKFVAGNWKMNTNKAGAVALAKGVAAGAPAGVDVGIAVPFVYIDAVAAAIAGSSVLLGAQDAYFEKNGAFTGEISVEMLKDLGVKFCLTGHSERRHIINEPSELVAKKAAAIYDGGLTLVHCVGEKLEERDAGQTLAVVQKQLDELQPGKIDDPQRLVIGSGWSSPMSPCGPLAPAATPPMPRLRRSMRTSASHWARCGTRILPIASASSTVAA